MHGLFISFEGGEGAGKSTQIRHLAEAFQREGRDTIVTREPGGSPLAEAIRGLILTHDAASRDEITQAMLFAAARRDHCQKTIRPALEAGNVVLCDRFADSTRAYQGASTTLPAADIEKLITLATDGLAPNLTFLLDLAPEIGLARANKRRIGVADTFERSSLDFHQGVRMRFLALAKAEPNRFIVLDATLPELQLAQMIFDAAHQHLKAGAQAGASRS